jgi:MFS family permease
VLIVATLLMTLCSVWCAKAESFDSLVAARIFQGAGGGAADTVAPALIGDLFFIHERGRAMVRSSSSSGCFLGAKRGVLIWG